jgi:hypothetical protein
VGSGKIREIIRIARRYRIKYVVRVSEVCEDGVMSLMWGGGGGICKEWV